MVLRERKEVSVMNASQILDWSPWMFYTVKVNRKRREVLANIFADLAKYTVGAGLLAGFWSGKLTPGLTVVFLMIFVIMTGVAYVLTPKDADEVGTNRSIEAQKPDSEPEPAKELTPPMEINSYGQRIHRKFNLDD